MCGHDFVLPTLLMLSTRLGKGCRRGNLAMSHWNLVM